MVPDSLAAVVSFLLLLAPGIVWQLQRARHRPATKESTVIEISRVVLASFLATCAAAVLLLPVWLHLFRAARDGGAAQLETPVGAVPYVAAVLATSALACGLAFGTALLRWPGRASISGGRIWDKALVDWRPDSADPPYLTVELLDGTIWKGQLLGFDSAPDDTGRDLALGRPLRRRRLDAAAFETKDEGWRAVILAESQIRSIQVVYPER